jgi:hypothetical protein
MQKRDFTIIAVRLMALFIILFAVNALPAYLSMIGSKISTDPVSRAVMLSSIIGSGFHLLVGLGLWIFSPSIADFITKDLSETTQSSEEFTLGRVQVVAVSLVGVFVLSSAIPDLVGLIVSYLFPRTNPRYEALLSVMGKMKAEIPVVDIVKTAVKLGLGFWLLLGANGIVGIVRAFGEKGKTA